MGNFCCGEERKFIEGNKHPYFKICIIPIPLPSEDKISGFYSLAHKNAFSNSQPIVMELWTLENNFGQNSQGKLASDIFYSNCDCVIFEIDSKKSQAMKSVDQRCQQVLRSVNIMNPSKKPKVYLMVKTKGDVQMENLRNYEGIAITHDWEVVACKDDHAEVDCTQRMIVDRLGEEGLRPRGFSTPFAEMDDEQFHKEVDKVFRVKKASLLKDDIGQISDERDKRLDHLINSSIISSGMNSQRNRGIR